MAVAREALIATQIDKRREAMERAAEAAALAAAECAAKEKAAEEDDEDDPLDKFMENIAKEVKSVRGNTATTVSTKSNVGTAKTVTIVKQEPVTTVSKGSVVQVIAKTVKSEVRTDRLSF